MRTWDDLLWLYSQPEFIALLLFSMALYPLLKFLRRFYPESLQKAANESENFAKELQKNSENRKIYRKANMKIGFFIFGPTFILLFIYIAYSLIIGSELKAACVKEVFGKISTIAIITLGIYAIKADRIDRLLLQDDYEKAMELTKKQIGSDPFYRYYEKYLPFFGYFFILLGIVGFVAQVFF